MHKGEQSQIIILKIERKQCLRKSLVTLIYKSQNFSKNYTKNMERNLDPLYVQILLSYTNS
jgi:hypothetical protein